MPGSGTRTVWPGHLRPPGLGLCFRSWENSTELALLHYRAASPIRAATTPGGGEPDLRTCSLSPVRATSARWAASRGRCFKLCVLLMELLLKSNPQFNHMSQTRPYFTGTHRHQRERMWRPRRPGTRWPLRTGLLLPPHPASLPAGPPASPPKSRPRTVVLTRGYRLEAPDASGSLVGPQQQTC